MNDKHKLNITVTTKQYEKLRKLSFESRKSIALILREMIDEKLKSS